VPLSARARLPSGCFVRIPHLVFAALDESTPELPNGIAYVMTGVVLLADDEGARRAARAVLSAERTKPFHWHREGPLSATR